MSYLPNGLPAPVPENDGLDKPYWEGTRRGELLVQRRSDPAIDLTPLWSLLPPTARPAFLAAYGEVSEAALLRARVLALFLSATLALYGHAEGLHGLRDGSIASLERALTE